MCMYCVCGDIAWKYNPPYWPPPPSPYIPNVVPHVPFTIPPVTPLTPVPGQIWPIDQMKEYLDLLQKIKALEDQLGCPCEPNKADYITIFSERIKLLEEKAAELKAAQEAVKP